MHNTLNCHLKVARGGVVAGSDLIPRAELQGGECRERWERHGDCGAAVADTFAWCIVGAGQ